MKKVSLLLLGICLVLAGASVRSQNASADGITLFSPVSGAVWAMGSTQTISWASPSAATNVNITMVSTAPCVITEPTPTPPPGTAVVCNSGQKALIGIADNIPNSGSFTWSIPSNFLYGAGPYILTVTGIGTALTGSAAITITAPATTNLKPTITNIVPSGASVGSQITIRGTGFTPNSMVTMNGFVAVTLNPTNDNTIIFTVPSYLSSCPISAPLCPGAALQVSPGNYWIAVSNVNGTSNSETLAVMMQCIVMPPCLTSVPVCEIAQPAGGWCPTPTPSPTPTFICPPGAMCVPFPTPTPSISFTTPSLPDAVAGQPYSTQVSFNYTGPLLNLTGYVAGLPGGMSSENHFSSAMNNGSIQIAGMPTESGVYHVTITLNAVGGNASASIGYTLNVLPQAATPPGINPFPDGTLIQIKGNPTVYLVKNGYLTPFTSGAVFTANGFAWGNVKVITGDQAASMTKATTVVLFPDGTLVKGSGPTVYVIAAGGKKFGIPSLSALTSLGFSLGAIDTVSDGDLQSYSDGGIAQ